METTTSAFEREHLLTFMVRPSDVRYPAPKAPAFIERVLAEVSRVPGVQAASVDGCTAAGDGMREHHALHHGT
jgi:hypothetical protein